MELFVVPLRLPRPGRRRRSRRPDITLAHEQLDWQPTVRLEDGLRETIGYFRHRLGL